MTVSGSVRPRAEILHATMARDILSALAEQ